MTTQEIYKLASELTEQQVDNIFSGWKRDNEIKTIELFNSLVILGDSKELACASAIAEKYNKKDNADFYCNAYNI